MHPEEPPPEDAMPPAGHEETGPVKGDEVSGGLKAERAGTRPCGAVDLRRCGPGGDSRANEPEELWPRED